MYIITHKGTSNMFCCSQYYKPAGPFNIKQQVQARSVYEVPLLPQFQYTNWGMR